MNIIDSKINELNQEIFTCRLCLRLVEWREQVALEKRRAYRDQEYWGKPVPGFGDPHARLLIVGLAPGAHGSNRTGRMFTGDASGNFLFAALHKAGFASQPGSSHREDNLVLHDCWITAICRCAPPGNKPTLQEITACRPFLVREMALLESVQGIVALGRMAFDSVLKIILPGRDRNSGHVFSHGAFYELGGGAPWLLASYHPSQQNTLTGRLTRGMFDEIWSTANHHLS